MSQVPLWPWHHLWVSAKQLTHLICWLSIIKLERYHEDAKPFTPALLPFSSVWQGEYWDMKHILQHRANRLGSLTQKTSKPVLFTGVHCEEGLPEHSRAHTYSMIILHNVFCNQEPGLQHEVSLGFGIYWSQAGKKNPSQLIIFITYGIKEGSKIQIMTQFKGKKHHINFSVQSSSPAIHPYVQHILPK